MVYTRYAFASELARGRRTLELGCASGVGLGLLLRTATSVVGGDLHLPMLLTARSQYRERVPLLQLSAASLPFRSASFDFVLFLEATYYVRELDGALDEIDRVLAPDGLVLFVNANPERPDFIRSPHSERYHSAREFRSLLEARGFDVETKAAFPLDEAKDRAVIKVVLSRILRVIRRIAEALRLVPRTLRGRARIKRLLFGKLLTLPREIPPDFAAREPVTPVGEGSVSGHKVIYVIGRRTTSAVQSSVPLSGVING